MARNFAHSSVVALQERPPLALPHRKIGVVLSNLGTPEGTDYWSMRRYLAEFLSDRRVIEPPGVARSRCD
jgi:ferrochelatase